MAFIGGVTGNAVQDRIKQRYLDLRDALIQRALSEGVPYGYEVLHGRDLYDNLVEMRATGDPRYYRDPRAAQELARLAELYGPPPPITPPFQSPFQGVV